jgi:hypothetical protein
MLYGIQVAEATSPMFRRWFWPDELTSRDLGFRNYSLSSREKRHFPEAVGSYAALRQGQAAGASSAHVPSANLPDRHLAYCWHSIWIGFEAALAA